MDDLVARGKPVLATIEAARIAAYLVSDSDYTRADAFLVALLSEYGVPTPSAPLRRVLLEAAMCERTEKEYRR